MARPTMAMRPTAALAKAVGTEAGLDVDDDVAVRVPVIVVTEGELDDASRFSGWFASAVDVDDGNAVEEANDAEEGDEDNMDEVDGIESISSKGIVVAWTVGDEVDVLSTSSRSDSLGVRITSGLGGIRAGSSENAVGWTGFEKWRVAVIECCAKARELVARTTATKRCMALEDLLYLIFLMR